MKVSPIQQVFNEECKAIIQQVKAYEHRISKEYRLDYCKAWYYKTENFILLRSYNTIVAIYDIKADTLYDVLRCVYGYTATSAKHISKFRRVVNPLREITYRDR